MECFDASNWTDTYYAVRVNSEGAVFSNCTILSPYDPECDSQFASSTTDLGQETWSSLTKGNVDSIRNNCYVFENVAAYKAGNGGKYNADGTITAGTYTEAKDLYVGDYWTKWGF